jgi:hypothetical protein
MDQSQASATRQRVMTEDLIVYHDDDFILALLLGGPDDGTQVRINVQRGLVMTEGRAILPPDLFTEGMPEGAGYRAWTIMDGKARYRWYGSAQEREALI